jgi:hypothetical protein
MISRTARPRVLTPGAACNHDAEIKISALLGGAAFNPLQTFHLAP